jgi:hypothetical protein
MNVKIDNRNLLNTFVSIHASSVCRPNRNVVQQAEPMRPFGITRTLHNSTRTRMVSGRTNRAKRISTFPRHYFIHSFTDTASCSQGGFKAPSRHSGIPVELRYRTWMVRNRRRQSADSFYILVVVDLCAKPELRRMLQELLIHQCNVP